MIFRYPLKEKVNHVVLPDNMQNVRILVSPTDGEINLYADVNPANSHSKKIFLVLPTGEQEQGVFLGSVWHGSLVYHVYDVTGVAKELEPCLVFEYPDSVTGGLRERVVFDYDIYDEDITGHDQSRNGEYRHFNIAKIANGAIRFERRERLNRIG